MARHLSTGRVPTATTATATIMIIIITNPQQHTMIRERGRLGFGRPDIPWRRVRWRKRHDETRVETNWSRPRRVRRVERCILQGTSNGPTCRLGQRLLVPRVVLVPTHGCGCKLCLTNGRTKGRVLLVSTVSMELSLGSEKEAFHQWSRKGPVKTLENHALVRSSRRAKGNMWMRPFQDEINALPERRTVLPFGTANLVPVVLGGSNTAGCKLCVTNGRTKGRVVLESINSMMEPSLGGLEQVAFSVVEKGSSTNTL